VDIQERRTLQKHIKRLDPKGEFVKVDLERNEVRYTDLIKQHRKIRELGKEEIIRAYLVVKLITQLGYAPDCIELEKEHIIGRAKKRTSARIDVLVKRPDNSYETFMIIEVKAPDEYDKEFDEIRTQLFQVARLEKGTQYLIYYTAYVFEQDLKERLISISYSRYDSYNGWESEGKPNLMGIPQEYAIVKKPVFTKTGIPDLRKDVSKDEFERIRKDLHNILWGGGRYHGNEIFNFVMKLFLAKIYDEKETDDKKAYNFQIFYENGDAEKPEKTYQRVNELYKKALKDYLLYPAEEIKKRDIRRIGDKTIELKKVKYVVEAFQDLSLTKNIHDILGDFFERFLWDEFKQSKGQFFTHPNIVNFIIQSLGLEKYAIELLNNETRLPYIIDPACGSGTFLIETMKRVTSYILENSDELKTSQRMKEFTATNFPENKKHAWAERYLYGIDYNEDLSMATKVNMVMHGDGSVNIESEDAISTFDTFRGTVLKECHQNDVYSKPVNEQFDAILSNPPFSITLAKYTEEELPKIFVYANKGSSENLFVERWYQLLRPKGRLGVVLPESFFDTEENKYIRLFLFKYFNIKAIVSLPTLTFEPYTSTRTGLLFAQKKEPDEVREYEKLWSKYKEDFEHLIKDINSLIKQKEVKLDETKSDLKTKFTYLLKELINSDFNESDVSMDFEQLKKKYGEYVEDVDEEWWVFHKVASELGYEIFMAIAEEIGYKRTKRSERKRANDLEVILADMKVKVRWD
jgi:type I restriction enzyme M protein